MEAPRLLQLKAFSLWQKTVPNPSNSLVAGECVTCAQCIVDILIHYHAFTERETGCLEHCKVISRLSHKFSWCLSSTNYKHYTLTCNWTLVRCLASIEFSLVSTEK